MFFKKRNAQDLWKKDSRKLLKTFIIWSLIGYMFYVVLGICHGVLTLRSISYSILRGAFLNGYIPINLPLWFLFTLFWVRLIANLILPKQSNRYMVVRVIGIVILGCVIAFVANKYNHRLLPYWIANISTGLCFFTLGYVMHGHEKKRWISIPSVLMYIFFCVKGFHIVNMFDNKLITGNYLLWIPTALTCIVTFNSFCRFLYRFVKIKFIEEIGNNAMSIYVSHALIYVTIEKLLSNLQIQLSWQTMLCVMLVAYAILLPFFCKFLKTELYMKIYSISFNFFGKKINDEQENA